MHKATSQNTSSSQPGSRRHLPLLPKRQHQGTPTHHTLCGTPGPGAEESPKPPLHDADAGVDNHMCTHTIQRAFSAPARAHTVVTVRQAADTFTTCAQQCGGTGRGTPEPALLTNSSGDAHVGGRVVCHHVCVYIHTNQVRVCDASCSPNRVASALPSVHTTAATATAAATMGSTLAQLSTRNRQQ